MKVRVTLTVEVDSDAWAEEYGLVQSKAVREDVEGYVRQAVFESPAAQAGLIREGVV